MSPSDQAWSPSTTWWYAGSFAVFVFVVSFSIGSVELPGSLLLVAAAGLGFNMIARPVLSVRERGLEVTSSDVPQAARKGVRRAIVAGTAPADPVQRAAAHRLAAVALGEALRHEVVVVAVLAVFTASVAVFAMTTAPAAWLVVGVDVVALLVQLLWPTWLRRRVAVLAT